MSEKEKEAIEVLKGKAIAFHYKEDERSDT